MLRKQHVDSFRNRVFFLRAPALFVRMCLAVILIISSNHADAAVLRKLPPSLKSFDLSTPPSTEEIMAAGQLGGQLYPTRDVKEENSRSRAINLSFATAMENWNRHDYKKAVLMLKEHLAHYPDSPWVAEAMLHLGCDAQYNGKYSDANRYFRKIIDENRGKTHQGAKALYDKARLRLGILKVFQNNFPAASGLFSDLKKDALDWRERTYAAHWLHRLSTYKTKGKAMLNCGSQALAYLLEKKGKNEEAGKVADIVPAGTNGQSLEELVGMAKNIGHPLSVYHLTMDAIRKLNLPAILHVSGENAGDSGHYWVLEEINGETLKMFDPQARKYFYQEIGEAGGQWSGYALADGETGELPGDKLAEADMAGISGGCCGVPRAEDGLGCPDGHCKDGPSANGAPVWTVNMVNMNLFMTDIPLWYSPPIGPKVEVRLSYNSQSAIAQNEPFGSKWQFSYSSYLVVDTAGEVTVFMPDGRRDVYSPNGSGGYAMPYHTFNTLTKIAENHFELKFPDGAVYVYNIPAGTASQQPFLVEQRDSHGQKLTFSYNSSIHLAGITDATGKSTTLTYNAAGLATKITDPFGRSAQFEYDTNDNLTKITDMGGYWTKFSYNRDVYLTGLENAAGTWGFYVEPADGIDNNSNYYPLPGDIMWENYRITVTNPLGGKEEYYYDGYHQAGWYVTPRFYPTPIEERVFSRQYDYFLQETNRGEISGIRFPEDGYYYFEYDQNGNRLSRQDPRSNTTAYAYNNLGRLSSITDAKGAITTLAYAANGVDLTGITNGLGTVAFTYNSAHDVASIGDRLGNGTTITYNGYGQPVSVAAPLGVSDSYSYDANHFLTQIARNGTVVKSFTYDTVGRVRTMTDSNGVTLTYDYNNLNDITKVTFPDGKYVSVAYSTFFPHVVASITDRAGRITTYGYDAMKRLSQTVNPEGGLTRFEYDANSNLTRLIDPNGNITRFQYDRDDRPVTKTYANNGKTTYAYHLGSLLSTVTDARQQSTSYSYDENYNLTGITYSGNTAPVGFGYDIYNRRTTMTDGIGTYTYTFDKNSRLTAVDGPWYNDTITYQYDALGRRTGRGVQGGSNDVYTFDQLNRLTGIAANASAFSYAFKGGTPLVSSLTRPNGSVTSYQYDALARLSGIANKNSSAAVISSFDYAYNSQDLRSAETVTNGPSVTNFQDESILYNVNNANQLLDLASPARPFAYDANGNMIRGYTSQGYQFFATYDAANRLASIQYTNGGGTAVGIEYQYAGDGFLAIKKEYRNAVPQNETRYVRSGPLVLQERNGSNAVTNEYTWGLSLGGGIGGLLSLRQNGQNYYYLYDGKGNVSSLINSAQSVTASYAYDPFGNLMAKSGTLTQPFMFSTKQYDDTIGLSYYGYRFYSPSIGRWMTRDPMGEGGGINLYGFVDSNPVNWIDPIGLQQCPNRVWSEEEVQKMLDDAVDKYNARSWLGALAGVTYDSGNVLPGGGGYDFKTVMPDDVFNVPGVGQLNAGEFGNYFAGYVTGVFGTFGESYTKFGGDLWSLIEYHSLDDSLDKELISRGAHDFKTRHGEGQYSNYWRNQCRSDFGLCY